MTVQTKPGPVVADADDLVIEHRGKRVLIKVETFGVYPKINAYSQTVGATSWTFEGFVDDEVFANDTDIATGARMEPSDWIAKAGGPAGFVASMLPAINAVLARVWPATGESMTPLEQVHALLGGLRVIKAADGTVRVEP